MRSSFDVREGDVSRQDVRDFLDRLRGLDIYLSADGERLRLSAPKGVLTPELQAEIAGRKAEVLAFLRELHGPEALPPVRSVPRGAPLPLSVSQERIFFSTRLYPASPLYNMYLAFRLEGPLNAAWLEAALSEVVRRHEILRTVIRAVYSQTVQLVAPFSGLPLPVSAASIEPGTPLERQVWLLEEAGRPFDLESGPLLRTRLFRLGPQDHVLFVGMHHIVSDGWSWEIFLRELRTFYAACAAGIPADLPDLTVQYGDFAAWQMGVMDHPRLAAQLEAWRQRLAGLPGELQLPSDRPRPAVETYRGARRSLALPEDLTRQVKAFGRSSGSTPFMVLLAAFEALLHRYTGQTDLVVCSPVAGRTKPEVEQLIGYFNNLLPLRSDLAGNPTFLELAGRVSAAALDAYVRQDVPYHRIAESPGLERLSLARAVFALQDPAARTLELPGLRVTPLDLYNETANFDLFLVVEDRGETLEAVLEYKTALFSPERAEQLLADYRRLLEAVIERPGARLDELLPGRAAAPPVTGEAAPAVGSPGRDFVAPRTALESRLARLWEEALGVSPIGIRDSFFELGGHSLMALKLFGKIEHQTGANLPLAALLQNPTIEALAGLIERREASIPWEPLVPVQPHGSRRPFFGVHGLEGNILFWRHIAAFLGPDQPFYGLQARGVDGVQPAATSIPEMAAVYIEAIRKVQPHGPYALGGYSMGGEIAFEMARQLLAVGERIGLLVLFETSNPARPIRAAQAAQLMGIRGGAAGSNASTAPQGDAHEGPSYLKAAGSFAGAQGDAHEGSGRAQAAAGSQNAPGVDGSGRPEKTGFRAGGRLAVVLRKLANHRQRLAGLTPGEQARYLWRDARMRLRRLYIQAATRLYRLRGRRLPGDLLIAHLVESHTRALDHYLPEFYPGTLTLFRARQSLALNPTDDPLGWGPLAAQVDLHVFDSTHNIVDAQFAREVAAVLAELLEEKDLKGL